MKFVLARSRFFRATTAALILCSMTAASPLRAAEPSVAAPLTLDECYRLALIHSETVAIREQAIKRSEAQIFNALSQGLGDINMSGPASVRTSPGTKGAVPADLSPIPIARKVNSLLVSPCSVVLKPWGRSPARAAIPRNKSISGSGQNSFLPRTLPALLHDTDLPEGYPDSRGNSFFPRTAHQGTRRARAARTFPDERGSDRAFTASDGRSERSDGPRSCRRRRISTGIPDRCHDHGTGPRRNAK